MDDESAKELMKTFLLSFFLLGSAIAGPKEMYADVLAGKAVLIDVRENEEVKEGMIDKALSIPLSKMEADKPATITQVKNVSGGKDIYVYCRSGRRSQVFIDHLKTEKVRAQNAGGYQDLITAGLPKKP